MRPKKFTATIGIDIGGTNIKFGICDKNGTILFSDSIPTPQKNNSKLIINEVLQIVANLNEFAHSFNIKICGVGIGSPGVIDVKRGIVLGNTPNLPKWKGVNLKKIIKDNYDFPCAVDNDANLFLLAESHLGAAKGYKNVLGLTIGTGIGGAIIIDGKIYRGSHYSAGEIGHIPIIAKGLRCKCGRLGCLEAYASAPALVMHYNSLLGSETNVDAKIIFKLAKENDPKAQEAVKLWCDYLAYGIASAVNLINPEIVVIGGGVAKAGEFIRYRIKKSLKTKVLTEAYEGLKIKLAKLGNDAGWLGAAIHAIYSHH